MARIDLVIKLWTEFGLVKYIYETEDAITIYVYDITDSIVRASILDGRPYISLLRCDKYGNLYFTKAGHKVYLSKLEKLNVI